MRIRSAVALSLVAAGTALTPATRASANPDPVNGSVADGCQRNPAGLLSYTSPEWTFVGGKHSGDPMRQLQGSATLVHTADEDLPESHLSYDMDFDVVPDPAYQGLLAGSPTANGGNGNGNFGHDADQGKMHVEWETGAVPTFVWPTEGDRIQMWGQWVWDCGHWGQGIETNISNPQGSLIGTGDYFLPGQIEGPPPAGLRGEQTELHPIQALAVTRAASYRTPAPERETDFFASNDGTHAYAESLCAKQLTPILPGGSYGPDFSACVNTTSNNITHMGGRTFEFLAPAPPRPSANARLTYREIRMVRGQGFSEQLIPAANGLVVRVKGNRPPSDTRAAAFGSSFYVGWSKPSVPPPTHLRWTLKTITVRHSLAEPNPNHPTAAGYPDKGVYNLYASLNGYWNFIGGKGLSDTHDRSWAPGLGFISSGTTLQVNRSVDFYVPAGAPVRLEISGRECDLPRIAPCSANAELADANDHPGTSLVSFGSAQAALGDHTLSSPVPSSSDPNYQLTYSIQSVGGSSAGASPPGSSGIDPSSLGGNLGGGGIVLPGTQSGYPPPCAGGVTPQTRFGDGDRDRLPEVAGSSFDVSCTTQSVPASGRIVAVWVAVARRVGGGCTFLGPRGFGHPEPCRYAHTMRARGAGSWELFEGKRLPRGAYEVWASAQDAAGNSEMPATTGFNVR